MNKIAILALGAVFAVSMIAITAFEVEAKPPQQSDSNIVISPIIQSIASQDGAIQVLDGLGGAILYYGDTLCEIRTIDEGTGVVIHFATETTVLHLTDCVNQGTELLFKLEGDLDATFQSGDLLAVELNFDNPTKMVEVHREQTVP